MKERIKKVTDPNTTLHIYTRVSSMAQANEGTSLTTQHQLGVKKAKQLGFKPNHWDEGGKSSHHEDINGRPILLKLYEAMKRGEVITTEQDKTVLPLKRFNGLWTLWTLNFS